MQKIFVHVLLTADGGRGLKIFISNQSSLWSAVLFCPKIGTCRRSHTPPNLTVLSMRVVRAARTPAPAKNARARRAIRKHAHHTSFPHHPPIIWITIVRCAADFSEDPVHRHPTLTNVHITTAGASRAPPALTTTLARAVRVLSMPWRRRCVPMLLLIALNYGRSCASRAVKVNTYYGVAPSVISLDHRRHRLLLLLLLLRAAVVAPPPAHTLTYYCSGMRGLLRTLHGIVSSASLVCGRVCVCRAILPPPRDWGRAYRRC